MTKKFSFYIFSIISIVAFALPALAGDTKRDTVRATVMYGQQTLFDQLAYASPERIKEYRDSLLSLDRIDIDIIDQLNLMISISKMNKVEVASLIDSLFEMNLIPYALINQINLYINNHPPSDISPIDLKPEFIVNLCQSQFPADTFYKDWNTLIPHPYKNSLSNKDTSVKLILEGVLINDGFVMPIENDVMTSSFGWREGKMHSGIDLDLEVWDPVVSVFPGVVRVAKYYGGYGRVVVVRHYNGLETLYAHLHRFKVVSGEKIETGQVVGLGGSSGRSSGSHLHFEVRFKGLALNPAHLFDFNKREIIHAEVVLKKTPSGYAALPKGVNMYVVKKGDNLFEIAKQYGTSISKLCELNSIKRNNFLYVGQKIRII